MSGAALRLPLAPLVRKVGHRAGQALRQRDPRLPAQRRLPAHVQQFLGGAIGFAGIPLDLPFEARGHIQKLQVVWPQLRWSGFTGQVPSLTLRRGTAPEKGVPSLGKAFSEGVEQTPHPQP